jgi:hypothetical protein
VWGNAVYIDRAPRDYGLTSPLKGIALIILATLALASDDVLTKPLTMYHSVTAVVRAE